jgi:hypothetical protein
MAEESKRLPSPIRPSSTAVAVDLAVAAMAAASVGSAFGAGPGVMRADAVSFCSGVQREEESNTAALLALSVTSASISSAEVRGSALAKYTVYKIDVRTTAHTNSVFAVYRRYSEFRTFYRELASMMKASGCDACLLAALASCFPPKALFSAWRSSVVTARSEALGSFLYCVAGLKDSAVKDALLRFLQ